MKTLTLTLFNPLSEPAIFRAHAERWTDFVKIRKISGPELGVDVEMVEQLTWHSFRLRMFAEENGYTYKEEAEGTYLGGESR
jgi:hypothetical protein